MTTRDHRLIFAEIGLHPFVECKGPGESRLYWYQVGLRVVIVQQFGLGDYGWCEYIGSATNNVEQTISTLKQLKEEI